MEIYRALTDRLLATGIVAHVDLWNRNVEFIEQEVAWARPAVFVEFGPIGWTRAKTAEARGEVEVRLHVVTDWQGSASAGSDSREECLGVFGLLHEVVSAVDGLRGARFGALLLQESHTNHNHEELLESVEVFKCRCSMTL